MALYAVWSDFCLKLDIASNEMLSYCATKPAPFSPSHLPPAEEFYLEGLLSFAWQAWSDFCRQCVVESCMGTMDGNGVVITPHSFATSEAHVSGAAIRAKQRSHRPPYWGNTNALLRSEPTWGDVDVLATIVPRLGPANHGQLMAAFSSSYTSAKALQIIRNAAAHRNPQTLSDVSNLASAYIAFSIASPIEALFWIVPSSRDFLATHAFDELRDAALACIS